MAAVVGPWLTPTNLMVAVCVVVFTHSCLCGEKVEVAEPVLIPPQLPEPDLTVGLGGNATLFINFFNEMLFCWSLMLMLFLLYRIFKLQNEQTKLLMRLSLLELRQKKINTPPLWKKSRRRLSPPLK
jgi:hypothetical protein